MTYNGVWAFMDVLTLHLLLDAGANLQFHFILLFFCLSLGLLIYCSEHQDAFNLSCLNASCCIQTA
jgi:hypothetical protein